MLSALFAFAPPPNPLTAAAGPSLAQARSVMVAMARWKGAFPVREKARPAEPIVEQETVRR